MPTLVGFSTFAALPEEEISEKISRRILSGDQGMLVWWSIGAGVHVEPHMQPKMNHFAWTKEETILQVHGVGPWAVNYVDPADDPRKK